MLLCLLTLNIQIVFNIAGGVSLKLKIYIIASKLKQVSEFFYLSGEFDKYPKKVFQFFGEGCQNYFVPNYFLYGYSMYSYYQIMLYHTIRNYIDY